MPALSCLAVARAQSHRLGLAPTRVDDLVGANAHEWNGIAIFDLFAERFKGHHADFMPGRTIRRALGKNADRRGRTQRYGSLSLSFSRRAPALALLAQLGEFFKDRPVVGFTARI